MPLYLDAVPWRAFPIFHCYPHICTVLLDSRDPLLQSEMKQGFAADPLYGRVKCWPTLGSLKTSKTSKTAHTFFGTETESRKYRGTSLTRNTPPVGSYIRTIPRVVWYS